MAAPVAVAVAAVAVAAAAAAATAVIVVKAVALLAAGEIPEEGLKGELPSVYGQ
jgi:hypothetical protein